MLRKRQVKEVSGGKLFMEISKVLGARTWGRRRVVCWSQVTEGQDMGV